MSAAAISQALSDAIACALYLHDGVLQETKHFEKGAYNGVLNAKKVIHAATSTAQHITTRLPGLSSSLHQLHDGRRCLNNTCFACVLANVVNDMRRVAAEFEKKADRHSRAISDQQIFTPYFEWKYRMFLENMLMNLKFMRTILTYMETERVSEPFTINNRN